MNVQKIASEFGWRVGYMLTIIGLFLIISISSLISFVPFILGGVFGYISKILVIYGVIGFTCLSLRGNLISMNEGIKLKDIEKEVGKKTLLIGSFLSSYVSLFFALLVSTILVEVFSIAVFLPLFWPFIDSYLARIKWFLSPMSLFFFIVVKNRDKIILPQSVILPPEFDTVLKRIRVKI